MATAPLPPRCSTPRSEVIFNSIVGGLFREGFVPNGSLIDVGAMEGTFACFYADLAPGRLVHALDPTPANVRHFAMHYGKRYPNLKPMVGALGDRRATLDWASLETHSAQHRGEKLTLLSDLNRQADAAAQIPSRRLGQHPSKIEIFTGDHLFSDSGPWRGEALGFAHIDVEVTI